MNAGLLESARRLLALLLQETAAARRASLEELTALAAEKQDALAALTAADLATDETPSGATRAMLRTMLAAAEENALVLGAVAGAMEAVQDQMRRELAGVADAGTYSMGGGARRPRHSLAASINRTA